MYCLDVTGKERLMSGRCRSIGSLVAATLGDDRLERSHLQQTFAAAGYAEAARLAAAEAYSRISSGDDQVIDKNSPDRELGSQFARFGLRPEDGRRQRIGTDCVRRDRGFQGSGTWIMHSTGAKMSACAIRISAVALLTSA